MNLITTRITATVTFHCDPGVRLDPDKLAEAIRDMPWEFGVEESRDTGVTVGGQHVLLDWNDLSPEFVEVLSQEPLSDERANGL